MNAKKILEDALRKAGIDAMVVDSLDQPEAEVEIATKVITIYEASAVSVSVVSQEAKVVGVAVSAGESFLALEDEDAEQFLMAMGAHFAAAGAK